MSPNPFPFSFPLFAAITMAWLLFSAVSWLDLRLSIPTRRTGLRLDLARTIGLTVVSAVCAYIVRDVPYSFDPCLTPLVFAMVAFAIAVFAGRIKRFWRTTRSQEHRPEA